MDLQKDLEEYKKTCKLRADAMLEMEQEHYDEDKEIIIQNLDFCRYKLEHISVKDLPSEVDASEGKQEEFKIDIENPTIVPIHETDGGKRKDDNDKLLENLKNSSSPGRPQSQPEFSLDSEIPDPNRTKVYDFVMSKNCTLPQKLSPEDVQRLRRKWIIIGSLVTSTALLVVIVTLALIFN